ncbi:MAG: pyruvate dehydrogenase complex dihydrolipoamide acetyltransferase [Saprospiraceae bacterium]|jgi:pyruvate dehydrogenase E2 component (dihydrolipoamide acetyltransferase)|uniref:pyruvate dehydrogenase complex dihydrolipoamide acetyltransferase n=1 Tax=Candidatus Brachybacter algidus TaxID=2982024 RepID=UPI001B7B532C|nr:pyruvate dehydrogenase complex dihydrolipoamide acetyltransferase [Candidatus Brachybacter algidus]MBP7306073.1 pyruvate dehydrogenase complex dihydrolipoamide acetyltransferase [Saprospiraceae bacterium]MBK6448194.1 pyruvate dehydrogenase complex dihydrolipoamide acetyltransferase [Candidatus Brachybacter algidus]MBK7603007.1 pyruvate dehydrogenase complex dihydrolipoamide acetyltransferase [Candidatus Brachybacter algidus]MBK8354323.1 pyruvate dehydrogenase complex dihydrolipoamide acetylt
MAEVIMMPRLSDTMEEGNIVGWLKKVGDKVSPGDILAEVETDKATMELESFYEGTLLHIGVPEGTIAVGALLAIIGKDGEDISGLLSGNGASNMPATEQTKADTASAQEKPDSAEETQPKEEDKKNETPSSADSRVKASPLAKAIASDKGIDISKVHGSGDGGRIIKHDIETYSEQPSAASVPSRTINTSGEAYKDYPLTQIRKTIARRLGESMFTAPHFYLTLEVDMEAAMQAREALNKGGEVKISYNDLVIKAVSLALVKHPQVNSSWMNDFIRENYVVNIGVAVAVGEGLLVPVVKNANFKSLSEINSEVKTLAGKAKDKKLGLDEMQGNTFTISNLGMFDIEAFTAIINPPDACILAVGTIVAKPVVKNGAVVAGNTMKVTLSCDHRVVDGAVGAKFLQTFKGYMENPVTMLL